MKDNGDARVHRSSGVTVLDHLVGYRADETTDLGRSGMSLSGHRRRSVLIAPASDERKALKALHSDADEVVLDLEDAVVPAQKQMARDTAVRLADEHAAGRTVSVRINAPDSPWYADDVAAVSQCAHLTGIVLPKVHSRRDIEDVDRALEHNSGLRIQALLETPEGILNAREICAASERLSAVIIGYADLGAAIGRSPADIRQWISIQDRVLLAARAAGVAAIDGPALGIADDEKFRSAVTWSVQLGFDGKWVIHPAQIATVTTAFTPTAEQVEHARRVVESLAVAEDAGAGAALLDGQMLDEAVAVAARRVLAQAGRR